MLALLEPEAEANEKQENSIRGVEIVDDVDDVDDLFSVNSHVECSQNKKLTRRRYVHQNDSKEHKTTKLNFSNTYSIRRY